MTSPIKTNNSEWGPTWTLAAIAVFSAGILTTLTKQGDVQLLGRTAQILWAATLLIAGGAAIVGAMHRDNVRLGVWFDVGLLGVAAGIFTWAFQTREQAPVGVGLGVLIGGLLALGLVRRPITGQHTMLLLSLSLVLGTRIVAPTDLLLSGACSLAAFIALSIAWVRRPASLELWTPPNQRFPIPRTLMSIGSTVLAVLTLDRVWTESEAGARPLTKLGVAGVVIGLALISAFTAQRTFEFRRRDHEDVLPLADDSHSANFEWALLTGSAVPEESSSDPVPARQELEQHPFEASTMPIDHSTTSADREHPIVHDTQFVEDFLTEYANHHRRKADQIVFVVIEAMPLQMIEELDSGFRVAVLTDIGLRLEAACRLGDFIAHLDGPYFVLGVHLMLDADRDGLVDRVEWLLRQPTETEPPVYLSPRMVTMNIEPGVGVDRVLSVAAAAFTTEL